MSTCFFIGHRDVSDSVLSALEQEVERHITEYGITDFVVGHYGRFDSLAALALSRAKVRSIRSQSRRALTIPFIPPTWSTFPGAWPSSAQISIW